MNFKNVINAIHDNFSSNYMLYYNNVLLFNGLKLRNCDTELGQNHEREYLVSSLFFIKRFFEGDKVFPSFPKPPYDNPIKYHIRVSDFRIPLKLISISYGNKTPNINKLDYPFIAPFDGYLEISIKLLGKDFDDIQEQIIKTSKDTFVKSRFELMIL